MAGERRNESPAGGVLRPLTVAWFSYFPVEWLPDVPPPIATLPRGHPASWQRVLLQELERRDDLRLHVIVLHGQVARDLSFERRGVRFHLLRVPERMRARTRFWYDTWRIRSALAAIRPDVVHAWGSEEGAAVIATRLGIPHVITAQGLLGWLATISPPTPWERIAGRLERVAFERAKLVTAESHFAVAYLQRAYPPLNVRRVDLVPDALFHRVQRAPEPFRVLAVGAPTYRKGFDVLVRALDELDGEMPVRCVVTGSPPPGFEASTKPAVWKRLEFTGPLTPAEVAAELTRASIVLCPTRGDTGPTSVKEAVVAGVPVVASDVGGTPSYVVPDRNGLLFPAGDAGGCARAIRAAVVHPLFGQARVDETTLALARAELSPVAMATAFVDTYAKARDQSGARLR